MSSSVEWVAARERGRRAACDATSIRCTSERQSLCAVGALHSGTPRRLALLPGDGQRAVLSSTHETLENSNLQFRIARAQARSRTET